ncbi:hypothetical protein THICB2_760092 [Thiomonas sp. CB2]|uniref:Uncharacterized protein n=1 Tax=Thiomonas delicata TaxID=364030 RepID=A0A238D763_THIDL|nr:hypothetical protein THICB2_760092 [Thiomonas sp. CB2]CQR42446.1 hypothetical protein THICB3250026 [Thiomonas sp. CB3]SBP89075.1 hypothetical protein THIARS_70695 [Thiomonas delicata]VDY06780.1 protein of unknown function [Thiomonas sp. Bio17B3]VDY09923.1 protein of unknown function [Thiomonas sp. Sup16B3]VDY15055.1 conserved protein of unknown function [Thiomonas sp. OC7]
MVRLKRTVFLHDLVIAGNDAMAAHSSNVEQLGYVTRTEFESKKQAQPRQGHAVVLHRHRACASRCRPT